MIQKSRCHGSRMFLTKYLNKVTAAVTLLKYLYSNKVTAAVTLFKYLCHVNRFQDSLRHGLKLSTR